MEETSILSPLPPTPEELTPGPSKSRKRPRSESWPERDRSVSYTDSTMCDVVRDEKYYMEDGSCILLVENTLFNVSYYLHAGLSRHGMTLNAPGRYIDRCSRETRRRLLRCSASRRGIRPWRARRTTTRLSCLETLSLSSGTSCGLYTPCKSLST